MGHLPDLHRSGLGVATTSVAARGIGSSAAGGESVLGIGERRPGGGRADAGEGRGFSLNEVIEILADREHDSWARWQAYLFSKCASNPDGHLCIPPELVERWQRQIETPYADLSEAEKESDRKEVRQALEAIAQAGYLIVPNMNVPV